MMKLSRAYAPAVARCLQAARAKPALGATSSKFFFSTVSATPTGIGYMPANTKTNFDEQMPRRQNDLDMTLRSYLECLESPLLDVGCGDGSGTAELLEYLPFEWGASGIDTDTSPKAAWEKASLKHRRLSFHAVDNDIPYPGDHFHAVWLRQSAKVTPEVCRVLRSDKGLLFVEGNEAIAAEVKSMGFELRNTLPYREDGTAKDSQTIQVWQKPVVKPVKEKSGHKGPDIALKSQSLEVLSLKDMPAQFSAPVKLKDRAFTPYSDRPYMPETVKPPREGFPMILGVKEGATSSMEELAKQCRVEADAHLHKCGGMLFRGLPMKTPQEFSEFMKATEFTLMDYQGGTSIREEKAEAVSSASDELAEFTIEPHQEMAYHPKYPAKVFFFCVENEGLGGQSGLTEMRKVQEDMDQEFRKLMQEKGINYRIFIESAEHQSEGYSSWQHRIAPTKEEVNEFLKTEGFKWTFDPADDAITTERVMPGERVHPVTKEDILMVQPHSQHRSYFQWHPQFCMNDYGDRYPFDAFFGDGTDIDLEDIGRFRKILWEHTTALQLEAGDVLLFDNLLTAHSRMSRPSGSKRSLVLTITSD